MTAKRGPHARETKALSAKNLLNVVRTVFQGITGNLKRREISLTDCLKMKALFYNYFIDSWQDLFTALGPGFKGAKLILDSG